MSRKQFFNKDLKFNINIKEDEQRVQEIDALKDELLVLNTTKDPNTK